MPFHQGLTRAQGDPGFFGALGRIVGGIARRIPGPIGAAAGFVLGRGRGAPPPAGAVPSPMIRPRLPVRAPGVGAAIARIIPGGETGFVCPPGQACPSGFRLNKSDYFLRDGSFVATGTRCVKIRRINAGNGRAVRRAISRENAFVRLAVGTGLVRVPRAARVRKAAGKR